MTLQTHEYRFWRSGFRFGIASGLALVGVASPFLALGLGVLSTRLESNSLDALIIVLWFCTGSVLLVAAIAEVVTWLKTGRRQAIFELAVLAAFSWWMTRFEAF